MYGGMPPLQVVHLGDKAGAIQPPSTEHATGPPSVVGAAGAGQPPHKRLEATGGMGQDLMGHPLTVRWRRRRPLLSDLIHSLYIHTHAYTMNTY